MDKKEVLFKKEVTEDDIKNIIKEQLSVSDIKDSDRLIDDLFADSLDIVELSTLVLGNAGVSTVVSLDNIELSNVLFDNIELLTLRFLHFLVKEGLLNENNK